MCYNIRDFSIFGDSMLDVILDTLLDVLKLLPFLFLTFLLMEALEHSSRQKVTGLVRRAGAWGPVIGAAAGIVPQCGFSASAANLYSQRLITAGTLTAVFLSTSDEMIPVLISHTAPIGLILKVLACKLVIGMIFGFIVDRLLRPLFNKDEKVHISTMCAEEHCECEEHGIFYSALIHTLKTAAYILIVTFILNLIIHFIGEENLKSLIIGQRFIGPVITGIVGLVPNCAASIVITELYLSGALTAGGLMSGLLVGAGVGLLVLFRSNREHMGENFKLLGILYLSGVLTGIVFDLLNIAF